MSDWARANVPALPRLRAFGAHSGPQATRQAARRDDPGGTRADQARLRMGQPPGRAHVEGIRGGARPIRLRLLRGLDSSSASATPAPSRLRPTCVQRASTRSARSRSSPPRMRCRRGSGTRRCTAATSPRSCARMPSTTGRCSRTSPTTCRTCGRSDPRRSSPRNDARPRTRSDDSSGHSSGRGSTPNGCAASAAEPRRRPGRHGDRTPPGRQAQDRSLPTTDDSSSTALPARARLSR